MSSAWRTRLDMTYRVLGVVVGGYALWSGGVVLLGAALRQTGLSRTDAMLNVAMLGSLFYVCVLIWGFAAAPRRRPATVIAVLGAAAAIGAILLGRAEGLG
jgi:hypothetical protein